MTGPRSFRFLNVEGALTGPSDWNSHSRSRLWLYNLHYFDDLVADEAAGRADTHRDLIRSWIGENPPGQSPGWEPYPTSLRVVNWVKWGLGAATLSATELHSLATQVRWLRRRLEVHLLGNHLWANAKALVFAGSFFQGREADGWRAKGASLVRRELDEQILPDGGHFERSPMYHAIVLEDILDLLQLSSVFPDVADETAVERWRDTAIRMLRWLRVMTHPDGDIALFNDAAFGIAPRYADLEVYARRLGLGVPTEPLNELEALPDSGYVRLQAGDAVLIADVGPIGPDYLPGHAHADTLSFELSLHGQRVLVNGGTSTYDAGAERVRQRGTAAHNCVFVNDADSSEVWSSFRVARRARPCEVAWGQEADSLWLSGAHDGYRRLSGVGLTRRTWRLDSTRLTVEDVVEGGPTSAVARFRAHPAVAFNTSNDATHPAPSGGMICGSGGLALAWRTDAGLPVQVSASTWHPAFGTSQPTQVLEVDLSSTRRAAVHFTWA